MNWIILIVGGLCECGFTFCLGKAKVATGWEATAWYVGFVIYRIGRRSENPLLTAAGIPQ